MKKLIILIPLLLLSACGEQGLPEKITTGNDLPSFLSTNVNQNTSAPSAFDLTLNINGNESSSNSNANSAIENVNQNTNGVTNQPLNLNTNTPTMTVTQPVIDVTLLIPKETAFDCKAIRVYETMVFYEPFIKQFESLHRYSTTDIKNMLAKAKTEDEKQSIAQKSLEHEARGNITSSCLAKDQSMFLVVSEGDKGGYGFKVVRYGTQRNVTEIAQREDERNGNTWNYTPLSLGKRTGSTLSLNVTGSDGITQSTMNLSYDYVNNSMTVAQYCLTKGGKKTCGSYPYNK